MAEFYAACTHIKKIPVNNVVEEAFDEDYTLLPLYEKKLEEYIRKRHYSLKTNEYFRCRWQCYLDNLKSRNTEPFQFVSDRDLHIFHGQVKYRPEDTIVNRKDHSLKLKAGPGVDFFGQIPIPDELIMKRGKQKRKENKNNLRLVSKTGEDNEKK